jgi:hypothetical protein
VELSGVAIPYFRTKVGFGEAAEEEEWDQTFGAASPAPSFILCIFGVLVVSIEADDLPEYLESYQDQHEGHNLYIHTPLKGAHSYGY